MGRLEETRKLILPPPAEEWGYNQEEVESIIPATYLKEFYDWMNGQTMVISPDTGEGLIFEYDLERWCRQRSPIFD